jgi:hypothetical protein
MQKNMVVPARKDRLQITVMQASQTPQMVITSP